MATITLDINACPYFKLYRECLDEYCYMTESTKLFYEASLGTFNTGDRFYGAVEGAPNYLYVWTGITEVLGSTPSCLVTGVSRTTDTCP